MIGEKVQLDTQKMEVATTITNSTGRGSHVQCIAPADDDTARFVFFWFRDAMISVIIVPLPIAQETNRTRNTFACGRQQ